MWNRIFSLLYPFCPMLDCKNELYAESKESRSAVDIVKFGGGKRSVLLE